VRNTVVRAMIKVKGKPPIFGTRSPKTSGPIDLKFDMRDYVRDLPKTVKVGPAGAEGGHTAKGLISCSNVFLFNFYRAMHVVQCVQSAVLLS